MRQKSARFLPPVNVAAAEEASKSAGKWTKWGFIVGLVVIVLYAIFYVAMMPSV